MWKAFGLSCLLRKQLLSRRAVLTVAQDWRLLSWVVLQRVISSESNVSQCPPRMEKSPAAGSGLWSSTVHCGWHLCGCVSPSAITTEFHFVGCFSLRAAQCLCLSLWELVEYEVFLLYLSFIVKLVIHNNYFTITADLYFTHRTQDHLL